MIIVPTALWKRLLAEQGGMKLANIVTLSRAALILPIIALLIVGLNDMALGLYLIAIATDVIDGWLARRTGRASDFGAQLDAAVDNLFSLAILVFLLLAYPDLAAGHGQALAIAFGAPVIYLGMSFALCRKFLMFHFWSAKVGAVLLFCLWPLMAVTHNDTLIPITAGVIAFSRLEQIIFILRDGFDLHAAHGMSSKVGRTSSVDMVSK